MNKFEAILTFILLFVDKLAPYIFKLQLEQIYSK